VSGGRTRRATLLAGLSLALFTALGGCGEEGDSEAASSAGEWVVGSWRGELRQEDMDPFEAWATVKSLQDAAANRVRYSGLDCRGTWTPLGGDGDVYRFRERITAGRSETCKGVGTVTLRRRDDERLAYVFRGGGVESRGLLRPVQNDGGAPEAERDAMAQSAAVVGAPGRELVLSRVVLPPGASLALHRHRGTQVARVESGVLTYTVRSGAVAVRRGPSDQDPKLVRRIRSGQTAAIGAGEWIVEQPSDIHRAENAGAEPIVIYLATLLEAGAPPATPVE
jgi:quercetin dioxygenase-like cupin family protein